MRRKQGRLNKFTNADRVRKLERNKRRNRPRFMFTIVPRRDKKGKIIGEHKIRVPMIGATDE